MRKRVEAILLLLLIWTCSFAGVDPEEYLRLYREQKTLFVQERTAGEILYSVQYVPQEMTLIRYAKGGKISGQEYKTAQKELENTLNFVFRISVPAAGSREFLKYEGASRTYEELLSYYSFEMQKDISLVLDGKDTIPCTDYLFERGFDISPQGNISLGFAIHRSYHTVALVVNDRGIAENRLLFTFDKKELQGLPKLKNYTRWKN